MVGKLFWMRVGKVNYCARECWLQVSIPLLVFQPVKKVEIFVWVLWEYLCQTFFVLGLFVERELWVLWNLHCPIVLDWYSLKLPKWCCLWSLFLLSCSLLGCFLWGSTQTLGLTSSCCGFFILLGLQVLAALASLASNASVFVLSAISTSLLSALYVASGWLEWSSGLFLLFLHCHSLLSMCLYMTTMMLDVCW